ncbi:MAG: 4Fe-4S binding protein [Defluviitaleaceae bacterium]|nr:4Fe-4S binding protein [Defluviitaleaceae bacterium]
MAYVINDECINCGACEAECPTSCISQGEKIYVVNADECVDCGACAGVCPVDAVKEG